MSDKQKNGFGGTILAFTLGAVIGGGLALFTTPRSGPETRKKLRDMMDETSDKVSEMTEDAELRIKNSIKEGQDLLEDKADLIKTAVKAGIDAIAKEIIIKGFKIMNLEIEARLEEMAKKSNLLGADYILLTIADEVFEFALAHREIYILMFNADGTNFRDDPDLLKLYKGITSKMEDLFGKEFADKNKMGIYVFEVFLNGLIVEKVRNRVDLSKEEFHKYVSFTLKGLIKE
jgi:gas vesicle protein